MSSKLSRSRASKAATTQAKGRHPFLAALGERVRALRTSRGMTRKAVALAADVSERHLANLEYGTGNASILVLLQVAGALQCSLAELLGGVGGADVKGGKGGHNGSPAARSRRIALIGLRGAGKSTLGHMLAEDLGVPFVELSREVEALAGCSLAEIQALYGQTAYRRYERRALEEAVQLYPEAVLATPGGLVSEAATFKHLLAHCTTVWLQAAPVDHMARVRAQGDMRPMAASKQAMEDLKGILASRAGFYAKADFKLDTSAQALEPTFQALRGMVRQALNLRV
jgi:XRE family transcriptional regulator, aerobic/anaerobic benzoate catabolism transcriptional regulator